MEFTRPKYFINTGHSFARGTLVQKLCNTWACGPASLIFEIAVEGLPGGQALAQITFYRSWTLALSLGLQSLWPMKHGTAFSGRSRAKPPRLEIFRSSKLGLATNYIMGHHPPQHRQWGRPQKLGPRGAGSYYPAINFMCLGRQPYCPLFLTFSPNPI